MIADEYDALMAEAKEWQHRPYPQTVLEQNAHWLDGCRVVARLVSALEEQPESVQGITLNELVRAQKEQP